MGSDALAGSDAVVGVVLAAGGGRRFGKPKALVRFEGKLLVERAVQTLVAGGCTEGVVVLGASAGDVRAQAELGDARVVVNEDWQRGMSTSLRAGLAAAGDAAAAVVALADQPGVTPEVVARLVAAWKSSARPVAVATYDGAGRNPVVFGASVWPDVMAGLRGDTGARGWLRAHRELIERVEVSDLGDCTDIDTPEDLGGR